MKDIKSLYLAAKTSGKSKDIASYTEAINHLLESDPNGYILNLEYIIKSDIGLKTIEPFIEKYGFPIALYDTMVESLNACIERCHQLKKDDSLYTEMVTYFENWKLDHLNCFMMFENFGSNLPSNYVSTYYESNNKGIQNRKLVAGMINAFGEAAIPDMIITADSINATAVKTVFEYVKANESYKNPTMYEWMSRISDDVDNISESVDSLIFFNENCLTSIVNAIRSRQQKLYKESVIMQNNDILMEYSDSDLDAIQNLISFKEYEMTWAEEFTEKKTRNDYVRDRFKKKYKYDPKTNTIEVNGDRIKVDMDDSYVRIIKDPETGEIYDNDLRDGTSIEMHPNKDNDLLILDKKFFRLKNDKRREAILQHELGHRKLHRYDASEPDDERKANEKHAQKYLKNKVNDHLNFMELEADRFAANKAGAKQVIRGLRDFAKPSNKSDIVRETKSYKKHFPDCDVTTKDIATGELAAIGSRNAENKIRNKALRDPVLANSKSYKESYTAQLQDEIYSLYEEFDGILNPDGSPTPEALDESKWFVNTRNKKTGELPSYLSDNHDLKYGEEDEPSKATADATEDDPPLDYYKRPSTSDDSSNKSDDNVDNNMDNNVDIDSDTKSDKEDPEETTSASPGGNTNNYYYYTYTNSLNKNTNSYNKNHSDDHSTNKGNNRDNEIHDNHSSGDNRGNHYTGITPAQESVNTNRKLPDALLSKKKERFGIKPEVNVNMTLSVDKVAWNGILEKVADVNKKMMAIIEKFSKKYPLYGLTSCYDEDNNKCYPEKDGKIEIDVRKVNNNFIFDLQLPAVTGLSFYEFIATLKKDYPDEFSKYSDQDKWDMADAWWTNKFIGYDKSLIEITADIEKELKSEIKEIFCFGFWDDWDDIFFGFYLPASYLYPDFSEKDISTISDRTSKFAASITDNKFKHALFKKKDEKFEESCYYKEEVGDADDDKPKSDHPIKDTLQDIDSALLKHQQNAKKAVQNAQNAGRAFVKPFKRTEQWISKMVYDWKDKDENKIKEKMADPHARSNLFDAIKKATMAGSLLKAGLLLNPVFLVLSLIRGAGKNNKEIRLRNEMIGELKTELAIIDEKIKDADNANDTKAKYRLMRLKNEINKKLLRVGGDKQWKKFI